MVVQTKHGEFECKDITRKERRKLYRQVKEVYKERDGEELKLEDIHDLADEFTLVAFGTEKEAEKTLGGLTALQEDEVLMEIINSYMGFNNPSGSGG